ncbi:MAG: hypothetical protein OXG62_05725 [Nitrospinae bacterium]|nr:hypothetical protein [Nitrospinota bacterium]
MLQALGTIISTAAREPTSDELHCGLFDYYDHWREKDQRLDERHDSISHVAEVYAHDLVNLSVYAGQILHWLRPENIQSPPSVVVVSAVTEAFITVARSACDGLGVALSQVASENQGQVPKDSLRALLNWACNHPNRVAKEVRPAFDYDFEWFWQLRSIRDYLVHKGAHANIHCDTKQFNLWLHIPNKGWIKREPLLPILAQTTQNLIDLGDHISKFVEDRMPLPNDRYRTRMLQGVTIHSLYELIKVAPKYAKPSP